MKQEQRSYLTLLAAAGSIGLNFAVTLVVGLLVGRAIDGWLDSRPWGTGIGALLGFVTGMWSVAKIVMKGKMRNNG